MNGRSLYVLCTLAVLVHLAQECRPAKFLVVLPMPWKSHHFVYHSVMRELAARGHQIDYLTAVPMKNPPANVRHFLLKDDLDKHMDRIHPEDSDQSFPPQITNLFRWQCIEAFKSFFEQDIVKQLLASKDTYDVVMSEFQLYQEINTIWVHKFKALPIISLMVLGEVSSSNEMNGLPDNPAYMVDFITDYTAEMNFAQRMWNTIYQLINKGVDFYQIRQLQLMADEVARYPGWEDRPSLRELTSDMALVLVNMHHAVGHSVPKPPHVKEIGGMTLTVSAELPKDLKSFMDEAADGVVYFSLGSNVDMSRMTDGKLDRIVKMFRDLKYKVIMKWTGPGMPKVEDSKVLIREWLPQLGILSHPKAEVFVTHGGLQSTMETVALGIPIVGVPVFADQPKNINFLVSKGCGVQVNKKNFTAEALQWAIDEVAENPRYKEAIMKRSAILKDAPMKPLDEAVFWIEYVLKHGRVLQPQSLRMPFYQVYLLDVAAFLLLIVFLTYKVIKFAVKTVLGKLSGKPKRAEARKKKD